MEFFCTYTGEEKRMDEARVDKVTERADQFGTCLVMASSETKTVLVVPFPSKGTASLKTVTEEVARFSLETSSMDGCIFQGDGERAMRQLLRSVQFVGAAKKFGLKQDSMQPTLLMMEKEMCITVHAGDIFMVGNEMVLKNFAQYMQKNRGWNIEVKGPFGLNEKFHCLKREFWPGSEGCDIRCDCKQYESLAKNTDVFKKAYRKTPMDQNFAKKDDSPLLEGGDITKFRSVVGRLMYLAGERPDAQFSIQSLARSMAKPTQQAWKNAWHVCSYLQGTIGFGVRIGLRKKGQSVMDVREEDETEEKERHLIEVVTDADYAGNKNDRRSTTSFQIFIDGNLMESRVRSQKATVLSSGESEFVAIVAGCSDGMLIRHLWMTMVGEPCDMKVRSDSSAARAMVQRQGIGRVRHLRCSTPMGTAERE